MLRKILWLGMSVLVFEVWVFGQGVPYGVEFRVNTYTNYDQGFPQIISLSNGDFVVCWISEIQDGDGCGIYGQIFSPLGEKKESEFRVNTYTENNQWGFRLVSLGQHGFLVCWESSNQDHSGWGVYGQIFFVRWEKGRK